MINGLSRLNYGRVLVYMLDDLQGSVAAVGFGEGHHGDIVSLMILSYIRWTERDLNTRPPLCKISSYFPFTKQYCKTIRLISFQDKPKTHNAYRSAYRPLSSRP